MKYLCTYESFVNSSTSIINSLSNESDIVTTIRNLDSNSKKRLLKEIDEINYIHYKELLNSTNIEKLYHGSPKLDLYKSGLEITRGLRGGFMGDIREVKNLGIFLSDSEKIAEYYGSNKSNKSNVYKIYSAYADINDLLDFSNPNNIPSNIKSLALKIINNYHGSHKNKLAIFDIWWLLDNKNFVDFILQNGYKTVCFQEDPKILKKVGDIKALTYFFTDISNVVLISSRNDLISDTESLIRYINQQIL